MSKFMLFDNTWNGNIDTKPLYNDLAAAKSIYQYVTLPGRIIGIVESGMYTNNKWGYKVFDNDLSSCFFVEPNSEFVSFWVDSKNNVKSMQTHYLGTDKLMFRMLKTGLSEKQIINFYNIITGGRLTSEYLTKYTTSLGKYFKEQSKDTNYSFAGYDKDDDVYITYGVYNDYDVCMAYAKRYQELLRQGKLYYHGGDGHKEPIDWIEVYNRTGERMKVLA